ncbi:hypothetical protein Sme01_20830 [Sphaerisporangium melleum]|uniref:Lipoprotein n=1 Tax=Sphaerisporangium melleum TaxID=321316 RepID=A0A917VGW6_9ACTN|nr:hypothetical protein [Sphaerisporangium melleum]GGK76510.1 hypothetical protein GCM10007964_19120 [Sphaerisporangium melleum]GII69607.1 hypothetical protein Sme01_20830 [Sphaerisporangium melleum]
MGTPRHRPLAPFFLALTVALPLVVTACSGGDGRATGPSASAATRTGAGGTGGPVPSGSASVPSPSATGETAASPSWKIVTGGVGGSAALLDVAASGPRDVWAAGYQGSAEDREGLPALQHWDGTRWTETPVREADAWHLEGVSTTGPRDVWVVGNRDTPYAAHFDGVRWSGWRPFGVAEDYTLTDVAARGGREAWLVGHNATEGVIVEWNGRNFHSALRADGFFTAVTAKAGHVWAVGNDAPRGEPPREPMIWHGAAISGTRVQSWQQVRTPSIPGGVLRRIWMVSPADVWAVGYVPASPDGKQAPTPIVLHSDGASWRRVAIPVPRGRLDGLTAFGPDEVWISGVDADHSGQVLFLRFDGREWSRSYGPLLRRHRDDQQYEESDDIRVTGIVRVPGITGLWAVGSVGVGDAEAAFTLRHE